MSSAFFLSVLVVAGNAYYYCRSAYALRASVLCKCRLNLQIFMVFTNNYDDN